MSHYTRLSALDRSFLDIEDRTAHMHVGATCIFDAAPLRTESGGIDIERIRAHVASRLHLIPRYRQRLAWVPVEGHPVWVDDDRFNLNYHVRHTALPRPGSERQLKRLSGRVFSQQLDRGKPLWEMWVVEGLDGDRFAVINKVHHCMVDGIAGADLLGVLLTPEPEAATEAARYWQPGRAPGGAELLRDAAARRVGKPLGAAASFAAKAARTPIQAIDELTEVSADVRDALVAGARTASQTPLNDEIGAHRRFDWSSMRLDDIREVKNKGGGTVNDVVLATVSGAVAKFFEHRGFQPNEQEDFEFRIFCPVGLARASGGRFVGNRVSALGIVAPIDVDSPRRRLEILRERTMNAKGSHQAEGLWLLETAFDWVAPSMMGILDRLAARALTFNLVVTNVPGPQFPLYLVGARMLEGYPLVPLFHRQGIGVALLSYDGKLAWGFTADREVLPDLHDFMLCIDESFAELRAAVGATGATQSAAATDTTDGDAPVRRPGRDGDRRPPDERLH